MREVPCQMYVFSFSATAAILAVIKTLISVRLHHKILGALYFSLCTLINLKSESNCVSFTNLITLYNLYIFCFFSQANNISDPNIIIFEMTKDDRKDFYRTIGKQIE